MRIATSTFGLLAMTMFFEALSIVNCPLSIANPCLRGYRRGGPCALPREHTRCSPTFSTYGVRRGGHWPPAKSSPLGLRAAALPVADAAAAQQVQRSVGDEGQMTEDIHRAPQTECCRRRRLRGESLNERFLWAVARKSRKIHDILHKNIPTCGRKCLTFCTNYPIIQ